MSERRLRRLRVLLPYLGAAASGALLTLATPPFGAAWLAWVAPVPIFAVLAGARSGRAAWNAGFWWGFLSLFLLVPWFAAFTPVGYVLASGYRGLLAGLVSVLLVGALRRARPGWAPPLLASGWVVLEWLHTLGPFAFPWGSLAATQYRILPVLQMLDLTGAFGLSFLMALFAGGVACWVRARSSGVPPESGREAGQSPSHAPVPAAGPAALRADSGGTPELRSGPAALRAGMGWTLGAAALAAVSAGRGLWILQHPDLQSESLRVAAVQASRSESQGVTAHTRASPEEYEAWTVDAVRRGALLVAWPESVAEGDAVHSEATRARLAALLEGSKAHLLVGSFVASRRGGPLTNSAVMLAPGGRVVGTYAKVRIVPFGEYLPARWLLGWAAGAMGPSDLAAGERWAPVPHAGGSVGVSICFESAFGGISRTMVNQGADLLAILTSDGWADRRAAGLQHLAFAPLRAVETRRSLVRAAATGVTELIDPNGRVVQAVPLFTRGLAIADLPLRRDRTLYARLGDWPVLLALGLMLFGTLRPTRRPSA